MAFEVDTAIDDNLSSVADEHSDVRSDGEIAIDVHLVMRSQGISTLKLSEPFLSSLCASVCVSLSFYLPIIALSPFNRTVWFPTETVRVPLMTVPPESSHVPSLHTAEGTGLVCCEVQSGRRKKGEK
jgi:hypothetical protein